MIKLRASFLTIIAFSVLAVMIFFGNNSCKKIKNPNAGTEIKDTIKYDYLKTRVFVQFFDAATNENITQWDGDPLSVEVVGKSNMAVVDILGNQEDRYYPQNGFITFGILPEHVPSTSSPITFTIVTDIYNHLSASKEITITDDGDYFVKIPIINLEFPPEGVIVSTLSNVGNLYNGVVHDDVVISTDNSEAQVKVQAGTKLLGADSTSLTGKLNLILVYHKLDNDIGMSTIQGGISSSIVKNNTTAGALFFPAGVIDLLISDSDYKEAHSIEDKALEIKITIPNGTYNSATYSNYKSGDELDVYTYLPDTGLWNYSKSVSVSANLQAVVYSSGLYSYNFSNKVSISCKEGAKFKTTGGCQECSSTVIDGVIRKNADDSFISSLSLAATGDETIYIPQRTGSAKVYIDWNESSECNGCSVDPAFSHLDIDNMCTHPRQNLPLVDNGLVTTSITGYFNGQCVSDTNYLILPSFGVWVRHMDSQCWQWTSMKLGEAQMCNLIYGETYMVATYFNNQWQEWEMTVIDDSDKYFTIIFTDAVCNEVFGIL